MRGPARGPRVLVAPSRLGDVWCECGLPSVTTGSSCSHHCRRRGQSRARGCKVDEDTLAAAPLPPVRSNLTRKKKKKLQPRRPSPRCRRGVSCAAVARGLSVWGRGRGEWGLSPAWLIMEGHGRRPANGNLVPRRRRPVVFWTEQRRRREVGFIDRLNEIEPGWKIRRERK